MVLEGNLPQFFPQYMNPSCNTDRFVTIICFVALHRQKVFAESSPDSITAE